MLRYGRSGRCRGGVCKVGCRGMTDQPFGVHLTFLPARTPPDYPGYIRAIVDGGVKAACGRCWPDSEAVVV